MAITRIAVLQQVDPALALAAAPVHLDQFRHDDRFAPGHDARRFDGAGERAGKQRGILKFVGQPKL